MTKRIVKKMVSAIVAMTVLALAIFLFNPVGRFSSEDGDEDIGIGVYTIVEGVDVQ